MRSVLSSLLLLCVLVVFSCEATLPSDFVGVWVGVPEFSELGPWGDEFTFTISDMSDDGTQWLMRDTFPESSGIEGSFQDFYVDDVSQTMHYCGCIHSFYAHPAPTSQAFYDITTETEKKISFCLQNTLTVCETIWELTLKDDNTLQSVYKFPSPVKHLDVTYKRDNSSSPLLSQKEKEIQQNTSKCNREVKYCLSSSISSSLLGKGSVENDEEFIAPPNSGCPYAGLKRKAVGALKNPHTKNRPIHPRTGETTQFCYYFNEFVQYKFSWTYDEPNQLVDVVLQMPVTDDTTYIAFGIAEPWNNFPEMPGMNNSDIIMGWADNDCVISLYSDHVTGAPGVSTNQIIMNTTTSLVDGVLSVYFTRPFDTGHHTIVPGMSNQVIWSSGSIRPASDGICEHSSWNYHSNTRGRRMVRWSDGSATFDDVLAC